MFGNWFRKKISISMISLGQMRDLIRIPFYYGGKGCNEWDLGNTWRDTTFNEQGLAKRPKIWFSCPESYLRVRPDGSHDSFRSALSTLERVEYTQRNTDWVIFLSLCTFLCTPHIMLTTYHQYLFPMYGAMMHTFILFKVYNTKNCNDQNWRFLVTIFN